MALSLTSNTNQISSKRAPPILRKNVTELPISIYLLKNCKLWVWDFDDTLIDTVAYLKKDMCVDAIKNRSDQSLTEDIPHWRYFHNLIQYLVKHGIYVGIASFGTFEIILAYMNRIFGFNQHYFNESNIKAACSRERSDPSYKIPINKNKYVYDLMQKSRVQSFQEVVLFDDNQTNIADGNMIGINSILVSGNMNFNGVPEKNLFGPHTLIGVDKTVRDKCGQPLLIPGKFADLDNSALSKEGFINDDIANSARGHTIFDITKVDKTARPISNGVASGERGPQNAVGLSDGINPNFMYDAGDRGLPTDTGADLLSMRRRYSSVGDRKAGKNLEGFNQLPVRDIHPTRFGDYKFGYEDYVKRNIDEEKSTGTPNISSVPTTTNPTTNPTTTAMELIKRSVTEKFGNQPDLPSTTTPTTPRANFAANLIFDWNKSDIALFLTGLIIVFTIIYYKYYVVANVSK
jgi:hypothetical protein